ncbi:MAG TPA: hypothetical protein VN829_15410 [Dongiaceae bacterium]|nr:hypothetical protein [Dongiaceae bacterium]
MKSTSSEAKAPVVAAEAEGEAAAVGKPAEAGRLDETASSVVPQSVASLPMPEKSDADTPSPTLAPAQNDRLEGRETPVYASVPPHPMDALPPPLQTDDVPGQAAPGADGAAGGLSGDVVEGSTAGTFAPYFPAKGQGAQPISSPVLSVLTQPSTSPAEVPEPSKGPLPAGTKSLAREAKAPVVAAEGEGEASASKPPEAGQPDDPASSVARGSMASLPMPENEGPGNLRGEKISSPNEHGMPVALQDGRMQAKPEVNEISAPAEQNLPTQGAAAESPRRTGMNNKAELAAADKALAPLSSAEPAAALLSNHSAGAGLAGRAETPMPQAAAGQPAHRAIENVITGLPRIGAGSTSVVLNPDGNTQLVLHVKFAQGCLEAQAVLERGDFSAMGSEWKQLQNRLAEHGVRLGPLTSGAEQAASSGAGNFSSSRRDRDLPPPKEFSPQTILNPQPLKSGAGRTLTDNAREWWA